MTIPATPAEARAEQERWQKQLEGISPEPWNSDPNDTWPGNVHCDTGKLVALEVFTAADEAFIAAAPDLAAAHIALLGAYAEALERVERAQGLVEAWQQEVDEDYAPDYYFDEYEPAARAAEKLHWCAKELRAILPTQPPAQAPAGGEV